MDLWTLRQAQAAQKINKLNRFEITPPIFQFSSLFSGNGFTEMNEYLTPTYR